MAVTMDVSAAVPAPQQLNRYPKIRHLSAKRFFDNSDVYLLHVLIQIMDFETIFVSYDGIFGSTSVSTKNNSVFINNTYDCCSSFQSFWSG